MTVLCRRSETPSRENFTFRAYLLDSDGSCHIECGHLTPMEPSRFQGEERPALSASRHQRETRRSSTCFKGVDSIHNSDVASLQCCTMNSLGLGACSRLVSTNADGSVAVPFYNAAHPSPPMHTDTAGSRLVRYRERQLQSCKVLYRSLLSS